MSEAEQLVMLAARAAHRDMLRHAAEGADVSFMRARNGVLVLVACGEAADKVDEFVRTIGVEGGEFDWDTGAESDAIDRIN